MNTVININHQNLAQQNDKIHKNDKKQENKALFIGKVNENQDPIERKRQDAKKKALKLVGDAFKSDQLIDNEEEETRNKQKVSQEEIGEINDMLAKVNKENQTPREIKETENLQEELNKKKGEIAGQNAVLSAIDRGRAKSQQTMIKAEDGADKIVEAASKEIVGMLFDEGKDSIDEKMEKEKEAAKEKAQKKKEKEEIAENRENKETKQEQQGEEVKNNTKEIVELDQTMEDVQKEIKKMLKDLKLTDEDIKGAAVDMLE